MKKFKRINIYGVNTHSGVLDVLHCVLIDSPEALNVIKEQHIRTVISLIDKHGRDPKVILYDISHTGRKSKRINLALALADQTISLR